MKITACVKWVLNGCIAHRVNCTIFAPRGCGFEYPYHIPSPLFSVPCFSLQLCSYYACGVFFLFFVSQPRSSSSIFSVIINAQSKKLVDVIFTDPLDKIFKQKIAQVIYSHFSQDLLLSDFIDSSYSCYVVGAACTKGISSFYITFVVARFQHCRK